MTLHIKYPKNLNHQPNLSNIFMLHLSSNYSMKVCLILYSFFSDSTADSRWWTQLRNCPQWKQHLSRDKTLVWWFVGGQWAWAHQKWGHFKVSSWTLNSEFHWRLNKVCIVIWFYWECSVNCVLLKLYLLWTLYSLEDSDEVKLVW